MNNSLKEIILYKAYADVREEASRSYLGFIWWIVEPLFYLGAFYFVFGILFDRGGIEYIHFLLCGLVFWKWFSSSILTSSNSIYTARGIIQQIYVDKVVFPSSSVLSSFYKFMPVLGLLAVFLIATNVKVTIYWFWLPVLLMVQMTYIYGLSLMSAVLIYYINDFRLLVENGMLLLFFMSGIFFDISEIESDHKNLFVLNPVATLIQNYRNVLIKNQAPDYEYLIPTAFFGVVLVMVGVVIVARYDKDMGR